MVLTVISPVAAATISPAVDIVAIHGLGGDPEKTWTHDKSKAFWLRDFLPQKVPNARIMTFGYPSALAFGGSMTDIEDHARLLLSSLIDKRDECSERPLIFIVHSLGGIVIKRALLQFRLEPRYHSIANATLGIFFFGTPHTGSKVASYSKLLIAVANAAAGKPSSTVLKALGANSELLFKLTSDFRHQLPQYEIISFYEGQGIKGSRVRIVDVQSALLGAPNEEQIPVDADHRDMCKFETDQVDAFEKVHIRIKRLRAKQLQPTQAVQHNEHFDVPHVVSRIFTGHTDTIRKIEKAFSQPHTDQRVFVIYGLGGSGKTQLCLKFINDCRENYWAIFWVDASSKENITTHFHHIADALSIEKDVHTVKRTLASTKRRWLLVFDNADDPDIPIVPYFPSGNRGDIIVTSRDPGSSRYETVGKERLEGMSPDDAEVLLLKTANIDITPQAREYANTIVTALGCLALALVQAGAYIRESRCSLDEYFRLYPSQKKTVMEKFSTRLDTDYSYSVYTTWHVSLDKIVSMQSETSTKALKLLKIVAFLHFDLIPLKLFYRARRYGKKSKLRLLLWHDETTESFETSLRNAIALLTSFSLVSRGSNETFSLHPLVHEWCRELASADGRSSRSVVALLAIATPWLDTAQDYEFRRAICAHASASLRSFKFAEENVDEGLLVQLNKIRDILDSNGLSAEAADLAAELLSVARNLPGATRYVIDHLHTYARYLDDQQRCSEAIELIYEAIRLQEASGDAKHEHPDLQNALSIILRSAGQYDEALRVIEQRANVLRQKLGEHHPDTLTVLCNLAGSYSSTGQYTKALELNIRLYDIQKRRLGENHPDSLSLLYDLSNSHSMVENTTAALQLAKRAFELREESLGEFHPDTLSSLSNLASRYSENGQNVEAHELYLQVADLLQAKLGSNHPTTLISLNNLALSYWSKEQHEQARELLDRVVELRKEVLGEEHPDTIKALGNQGALYSIIGRYTEALELMKRVHIIHTEKFGHYHPVTLTFVRNLAICYRNVGNESEALIYAERARDATLQVLGENHTGTKKAIKLVTELSVDKNEEKQAPATEVTAIRTKPEYAERQTPTTDLPVALTERPGPRRRGGIGFWRKG